MGRATAAGEPASNKREAVLTAAIECFAAHGLSGTGMRDIARAAGLTEGTLYHYFPSKDALIAAAFRWSAFQPSRLREAMRHRQRPLRERLLEVAEEFLAALRRDPQWTRVVIRESLRAAPDRDENPIRAALIGLAAERTRALTHALRAEQRAGRISGGDPRLAAEHLFHALLGHFVAQAITGTSPASGTAPDAFAVQIVDAIVGDLGPRVSARRRGSAS
jgi:AcrR family transcriptional regulator